MHEHLPTALSETEHLQALTETALRTPLGYLASFLGYAEGKLPAVHEHLSTALAETEHLRQLAENATTTPLDHLAAFLRVYESAAAVVQAVNLDDWEQARRGAKSEQPDSIATIDREFRRLGRPELSAAPAETLIRAAEPSHWHNPVIGIVHLSHTLRMGRAAGEDAVQHFLDQVLTDRWLDDQYRKVFPGQLGAALLSIWSYHADAVVSRFSTHTLDKRVARLIRGLSAMSLEDQCHTLQLWGTAGLLRLDVDVDSVQWPSNRRCRELLEFTRPEDESIDLRSIQFWLGLRRMALHRSDTVTVPGEMGNHILRLWRETDSGSERQEALNRWMIGWLERCAAADWKILADATPLS